jgi:hypothetical protein
MGDLDSISHRIEKKTVRFYALCYAIILGISNFILKPLFGLWITVISIPFMCVVLYVLILIYRRASGSRGLR